MSHPHKPYVPADTDLPELTFKALLLGVVMAAILGAANAYLGFKAGQTVSATFPAAVIAIAAFRLPFYRGSILEQNIARTAATVGEALVAGAAFTLPAFVMVEVGGQRLWDRFNYWESSFILLIGGVLGILFITLLRRTLVVDADLPFPESTACAEIVKAGQHAESGAKYVFGAMGLGMLIQLLKTSQGFMVFRESVGFLKELPASVIHHFSTSRAPLGDVVHKGAISLATPSVSPALIGVGYIIGLEYSAINFSGGVLAWLVFIPLALFLNPDLGSKLALGGQPAPIEDIVFSVWYTQVRPLAVGAMLVGAMYTMWGMRDSIISAFRGAFKKAHATSGQTRLDKDLDTKTILLATIALVIPMTAIYYHFSRSAVGALVAAIVMIVTGFLFSAVGGYLVGLVGGSNQPVSGLALSTLIVAALLMVSFGVKGLPGIAAVLAVAAVVCCACAVSGSLIQDLKVGYFLGGTPWKMELAEMISTIVVAFVLVFPIKALHEANIKGGGIGIGDPLLPAPQAGLMAQLAQGIVGGEMPWGLIIFGMFFSLALIMIKAPSPMLVAVGMYLPFETTSAIFVGGVFKAILDWRLRKRNLDAAANDRVSAVGTLVASGLIAGESLTGVMLAGIVLLADKLQLAFTSLNRIVFGVDVFGFAQGTPGAWLSLAFLGIIAYVLIAIPAKRASA